MTGATFQALGDTKTGSVSAYLRHVADLPFTQSYVARSLELLGVKPGETLVDLACGVAHDSVRVASAVAPGGNVVFIDNDPALVALAGQSFPARAVQAHVRFIEGDAQRLELPSRFADGVRVVRALMHVADPQQVVNEMARIAKFGSTVVAVEPDWTSWKTSGDERVSLAVRAEIAIRINHPRIGADTPTLFERAGLHDVQAEKVRMEFDTPEAAERVFLVDHKLDEAVRRGPLSTDEVTEWRRSLDRTNFDCGVDFYIVSGKA